MEIVLLEQARRDRDYWKRTGNKQIMRRISALLADIVASLYGYRETRTAQRTAAGQVEPSH